MNWGAQIDIRSLRSDGDGPDDDAVAAYVAKYVTKGADKTGVGTDRTVTTLDDIATAPVSEHVRTLVRACWRLGGLREYEPLHLLVCRAGVTPAHPVRTAGTSTDKLQEARRNVRSPSYLGSSDKRPGSGCHRPGAGRLTRSRHVSCKHTPVFSHRDRCPDGRHTLAACGRLPTRLDRRAEEEVRRSQAEP
ncbi:replication initiator [Streptomyces rishiriensis]|uniref:replication initiator n=1 Tax=Streptomyces rishiriensis TaxID=68264 RepID=UPI0027D854D3|nr:replication initiator [Streptomyces rishiriensis]